MPTAAKGAIRTPNAERSAATKVRLLDATIESLVEKGWAGTSTTEIVRRAGVSRGAQVHHYPTKADLVLAAVEHLLIRRNEEFRDAFAALPADRRSAAEAMRLLYEQCFGSTFEAWLELVVAARCDAALRARLTEIEDRFFETSVATFAGMFPEAERDPAFAAIALRLAFGVLDGLAIGRMIGTSPADRQNVLDAFNIITAPFFGDAPGGAA